MPDMAQCFRILIIGVGLYAKESGSQTGRHYQILQKCAASLFDVDVRRDAEGVIPALKLTFAAQHFVPVTRSVIIDRQDSSISLTMLVRTRTNILYILVIFIHYCVSYNIVT